MLPRCTPPLRLPADAYRLQLLQLFSTLQTSLSELLAHLELTRRVSFASSQVSLSQLGNMQAMEDKLRRKLQPLAKSF
jgi:hypothetical protein